MAPLLIGIIEVRHKDFISIAFHTILSMVPFMSLGDGCNDCISKALVNSEHDVVLS